MIGMTRASARLPRSFGEASVRLGRGFSKASATRRDTALKLASGVFVSQKCTKTYVEKVTSCALLILARLEGEHLDGHEVLGHDEVVVVEGVDGRALALAGVDRPQRVLDGVAELGQDLPPEHVGLALEGVQLAQGLAQRGLLVAFARLLEPRLGNTNGEEGRVESPLQDSHSAVLEQVLPLRLLLLRRREA